jgi:hypothetical protein
MKNRIGRVGMAGSLNAVGARRGRQLGLHRLRHGFVRRLREGHAARVGALLRRARCDSVGGIHAFKLLLH